MASVSPPDLKYKPKLNKGVVENGLLSLPQLENVVYAGQAQEKTLLNGTRGGYYIFDGTGVGKGHQISGIIQDNFNRGRTKAVWLSDKNELVSDAIRDWTALCGDQDDVISLIKFKMTIPSLIIRMVFYFRLIL